MPWTNDQFTGTLVIPTGATSGIRIVLDGTTGEILVYDAANVVVYRISGAIPGAAAGPAAGSQVITEYTGTAARVAFPMNSPAENTETLLGGSVTGSGTNLEQLFLTLRGPTTTPNTDRIDVIVTSENVLGTLPARFRVLSNGTATLITADIVNGVGLGFTKIGTVGVADPYGLQVSVPGAYANLALEVESSGTVFGVDAAGVATTYAANTFQTYTPVIGNGGTAAYSNITGWYQRIGKMIFFNAYAVANNIGSGAGNITITAPTSIDRTTRQRVGVSLEAMTAGNSGSGTAVAFTTGSGTTFDRIRNSVGTNITGADITATSIIAAEGWYREA